MQIVISGGGLIAWLYAHLIITHSTHDVVIIRPLQKPPLMHVAISPELMKWFLASTELELEPLGKFREMQVHGYSERIVLKQDNKSTIAYLAALGDMQKKLEQKLIGNKKISIINDTIIDVKETSLTTRAKTIQYDALLIAEGIHSSTAMTCGWPKTTALENYYDFNQLATAQIVKTSNPHYGCSHQFFTDDGIFAYLPMHDPNQSVFITHHVTNNKTGPLPFGAQTPITEKARIPLITYMALPCQKNNIALIGDSRMRVHPLAGLGLNAGLFCAKIFAELLLKNDHIDNFWLEEYAAQTQQTLNKVYLLTKTIGIYSQTDIGRHALNFGIAASRILSLEPWMISQSSLIEQN